MESLQLHKSRFSLQKLREDISQPVPQINQTVSSRSGLNNNKSTVDFRKTNFENVFIQSSVGDMLSALLA